MATIFDGLVSEAETAGLESSSKIEAGTRGLLLASPSATGVYIHFSVGQD